MDLIKMASPQGGEELKLVEIGDNSRTGSFLGPPR
jgi:hypothetical protein